MGYVKSEIKKMVKEHGSKKAARSFADSWYESSRKSRKLDEVTSVREQFKPGKIYSFEYRDPITKDLPWFDMHPVVLALDSNNSNDLGVNLNLLPIRVKEQMLDDLYESLKGQKNSSNGRKAANDRPLRKTYDGIKAYLDRFGFGFAIRQYKPERNRNQAVITYKSWPKIALANLIELNGASIRMVRALHAEYMRK
jgi:hypothetical protein